ncbi:MAG: DUF4340 domain-containing protein [Chitinispirillales bacterium]|jgi:hypothetical protein|nr:DUF4340 domain-containing protein [Chitinispirillales bacterium]
MITAKKTLYSGILLVLVIAAMILSNALQNSSVKKNEAPFYPRFAENFGKIILEKGNETVILSKEDNLWLAAFELNPKIKYSADSVKVISIVNKIAEMKRDVFVGTNKANDAEYGLTGDSAFIVKIFNKQNMQIGNFVLGKKSENWRFNYFRENNSDKIYLVGGGIGFAFKTDINEWRNKVLFEFKPENISEITAEYPDEVFNIKKDDAKKWVLNGKFDANTDSIVKFLKDVTELDAGDWDYTYSIPDEISGLVNPSQKYTISQNDGKEYTLLVGNIDGDRPRYFVRANNGEQIAYIFKSQAQRLILSRERITNTNEQSEEIMKKMLEEYQAKQQVKQNGI